MIGQYGVALVSNALAMMLEAELTRAVTDARAICGHPGDFLKNNHTTGVNIFLYQVTPNAAWRNREVTILKRDPEQLDDRTKEKTLRVPVVPLNLYYIFSFYGREQSFEPQRLLALTVQVLHDAPDRLPTFLAQARSQLELPAPPSPPLKTLAEAEQRIAQIEPIKLNPVQLNLEELSKLWSVFFQVPYALSVAYEAAVVLLPLLKDNARPMATMAAINRPDRAAAEAAERERDSESLDAETRDKAAAALHKAAEQAAEAARIAAADARRMAELEQEREQLRRERDPWTGGPLPKEDAP